MIPRSAITRWRRDAPWVSDAQIEQDLIISRALVDIFSDEFLHERLAFRGGTALNKLFLRPASRYSEDIDLVQTMEGPIGPIIDRIRERLAWLGDKPTRDRAERMMHIVYSFESEIPPVEPLKLKVEINTREHDSVFPLIEMPFSVETRWFSGSATIPTFRIEELLATKLRALYQRRKGRDLYDFWAVFQAVPVNEEEVVRAFKAYMEADGTPVRRAEYEQNLSEKMGSVDFREDITPLLAADAESAFNHADTYRFVMERLISRLEGVAWRGLEGAF